jgi:hypothetical protein
MQIDDFERKDRAVPEHVQEDPDLDEPQLAGEAEAQGARHPRAEQQLLERGWAVSPGENYRLRTPPGIRVTTTDLRPGEAAQLAAALHEITSALTLTAKRY